MAILGSFKNKTFEVSQNKIYTFSDLSMSFKINVEEQEVEGNKPSTYIKGNNLDTFSLSIMVLKQKRVDVQKEVEEWKKILNSKSPGALIVMGKPLCNKVLLTSVSVDNTTITSNGLVKANISLEFSEFARWGSKKEDTTGVKTSSNGSKSSKKRNNTNAATSMSSKDVSRIEKVESSVYNLR